MELGRVRGRCGSGLECNAAARMWPLTGPAPDALGWHMALTARLFRSARLDVLSLCPGTGLFGTRQAG